MKYEFLQSVIGFGQTKFLIFFLKKNWLKLQSSPPTMSFFQLEFKSFEHLIIFLRVHFIEFHKIGCFPSCMKNHDCVWSKTPPKNVNRRHCLQEPFCMMYKSIDRLLIQEKKRKPKPEHYPNKTSANAIFTWNNILKMICVIPPTSLTLGDLSYHHCMAQLIITKNWDQTKFSLF